MSAASSPLLSQGRIGFVGLGNMGWPMARRLHEAGGNLIVWNRGAARADAAASLGMRRAHTVAELADAVGNGVVCLNLTTTEVVADVVFGKAGLHQCLHPDAMIMDFGTTSVTATKEFSQRITWVDAPVSGGQTGAEAGTLSIFVGGSNPAFERALPILRVVGKTITHLGPSGSGQVAKLANQLIVAQTIDAVAQALRLAEMAGLDPAQVRTALLGGFAESRILALHGDRMVRRDFVPGGRAALQLKDVRLICELAESLEFHSPALDVCRAQWEKLVLEQGRGDLDHSGLFLLYEEPPVRRA